MVSFSCDKCAETLKKNKVDAHAMRCGCESVSCVDCSVSFYGDDYRYHTSCVTEAERYEKTVYKGPKKNDKNGRKLTPQEIWNEIISESLDTCPKALESYLQTLSNYENCPRKEKAFRNFAANSLRIRGGGRSETIVTSIWNHLSSVREKKQKAKEASMKRDIVGSIQNAKCNSIPKADEEASNTNKQTITTTTTGSTTTTNISPTPTQNQNALTKKKSSQDIPRNNKTKYVVKAMKKALQKSSSKQLKMKEIRKIVQKKLESKNIQFNKSDLKSSIENAIQKESKIFIQGKIVKFIS